MCAATVGKCVCAQVFEVCGDNAQVRMRASVRQCAGERRVHAISNHMIDIYTNADVDGVD